MAAFTLADPLPPLAVSCDPFWTNTNHGFCTDRDGVLVRQAGLVVRVVELTEMDPNQLIPGLENKWIFAAGFVMSLFALRGLLR